MKSRFQSACAEIKFFFFGHLSFGWGGGVLNLLHQDWSEEGVVKIWDIYISIFECNISNSISNITYFDRKCTERATSSITMRSDQTSPNHHFVQEEEEEMKANCYRSTSHLHNYLKHPRKWWKFMPLLYNYQWETVNSHFCFYALNREQLVKIIYLM